MCAVVASRPPVGARMLRMTDERDAKTRRRWPTVDQYILLALGTGLVFGVFVSLAEAPVALGGLGACCAIPALSAAIGLVAARYRNPWLCVCGVAVLYAVMHLAVGSHKFLLGRTAKPDLQWAFGNLPAMGLELLITGAIAGLAYGVSRRVMTRLRPGRCRSCGYDLTGNVSGVCPECGTPIQTQPP